MNKNFFLKAFAMLSLAVFALVGCETITEGTVVDKGYEEAYTTTHMQCSAYNKQGFCTVQVPITTHHDEEWWIEISQETADGTKSSKREVTEDYYNQVEMGDYVDFGGDE